MRVALSAAADVASTITPSLVENVLLVTISAVGTTVAAGFFSRRQTKALAKRTDAETRKADADTDGSRADASKTLTDATIALLAPMETRINALGRQIDEAERRAEAADKRAEAADRRAVEADRRSEAAELQTREAFERIVKLEQQIEVRDRLAEKHIEWDQENAVMMRDAGLQVRPPPPLVPPGAFTDGP